jgi:hypothetical protein
VAVVSESFVRRYWPNRDPIGQRFTFAFADREVVGVVAEVRFRGLERVSEPQVYLSSQQVNDGSIVFYAPRSLAIRTRGEPSALAPAVRAVIRRADPKLPITELPGVILACIAGRSMEALLAGVKPTDAPTLVTAVGFSVLMVLLGSFAATLRALRVDPMTALRSE